MKPLIKYRGGKAKEIPHILKHIPSFAGRYVEPFFGGGALYFYLEPSRAIINDINTRLIEFYRGVRDDFDTLRKELDEIEAIYRRNRAIYEASKRKSPDTRVDDPNEALYYSLRDMFNGNVPTTYSSALLYFFINKTAYSGMIRFNARGDFNVPYGRYAQLNTQLVTDAHSKLLQRTRVYNTDYSNVFDLCQPDDFVFLDPPYDCVFSDYGNELYRDGFSEDDHRRLAADFANLPCKAMMVIGRTELTESLYSDKIADEYAKNYSVNIRNRFKAAASHIVVTNFRTSARSHYPFASYPEASVTQLCLFENPELYGNDKQ